jgi:hypothetical protein
MVAGTSRSRTTTASSATARVRPRPMDRMGTNPAVRNPANTTHISSAAEVTIRPVPCRPCATAVWLSPVASHRSRMRESRNTS